jgi:hypothetical protein
MDKPGHAENPTLVTKNKPPQTTVTASEFQRITNSILRPLYSSEGEKSRKTFQQLDNRTSHTGRKTIAAFRPTRFKNSIVD